MAEASEMASRRRLDAEKGLDDPSESGDEQAGLMPRSSDHESPAAKGGGSAGGRRCGVLSIALALACAVVLIVAGLRHEYSDAAALKLATWNIAAINNNPCRGRTTHSAPPMAFHGLP